ncbi:4-hydroxyphenylpyruvate dioxygenase-like [Triticum dicoccoides]|uniref:4-hydroxyphenylpyruvate dioxygenase-like n=1 Tax=Triticum dicoccoides TaxID=85692 RepID=UPI001890A57A|nr:4-hydroxyphenylpyruvate dioxygenase-like [Triticum dicoccoides]XP_037471129.1 4-hydroxyphenylpyruvate dioxygenase-like [Triticum dicoccoides]
MMNAHANLALAALAFPAHMPNSKFSHIRSRCTRRPPLPLSMAAHPPIRSNPTQITMSTTGSASAGGEQAGISGTDRFRMIDFHHVEFWCADAASAAGRFSFGLGVPLAAESGLSTGNTAHASHLLHSRSGSLAFLFSAPYAQGDAVTASVPSFDADTARRFTADHGLAVRAVAVRVPDAAAAFRTSVDAGARPSFAPAELGHGFQLAEVQLYGDAVLRFVSYPDETAIPFLPRFESIPSSGATPDYGLTRFDHIVGDVPHLAPVAAYIAGFTGFHEFSRFTGDQVGTAESSLNVVVLANNSENVLLTVVEPVHGTKRRSQVQTYLDHHGGSGVQHLAMASDDVLGTLRKIRARSTMGGFELLPPPPASYYDDVRRHAGDVLSEAQIKECQELGVRVDKDDHGGVVLQIFTKAAGDRPTLLLEFIQRIGCMEKDENGQEYQRGGCGGFGQGNVTELFKSIEDYEKSLDASARLAA